MAPLSLIRGVVFILMTLNWHGSVKKGQTFKVVTQWPSCVTHSNQPGKIDFYKNWQSRYRNVQLRT